MLALKVDFLTGVYMATRHNDPSRSTPEWPPHPDRLFSALVAAAAHTEADKDQGIRSGIPDSARSALTWLAKQGPPQVAASEARRRTAPEVHMPSNPHEDEMWQKPKKGKAQVAKKGFGLETVLPTHRKKAALPIPAVVPDDPSVYYMWSNANPCEPFDLLPSGALGVLQDICQRVTYLGRSRSLVRVQVVDAPPPGSFVPDPLGQVQLRVPAKDRVEYLIDQYEKRDARKPEPSPARRYRKVDFEPPPAAQSLPRSFDRMFIFKPQPGDPALPCESTLKITQTLRDALIRCVHDVVCGCGRWNGRLPHPKDAQECYRKIPPTISGHEPDSSVTGRPHIALVALPFVHPRQRYADGTIKGLALLVPPQPSDEALQILAAGLLRLEDRGLGILGIGTWHLEEVPADDPPNRTLDITTWTTAARIWTTVTPMVFGHFPKKNNGGEPKVILDSLRMVGIAPDLVTQIAVGRHSPLHGAPPSWYFKTERERKPSGQPPRLFRHVTLEFDSAVRGPIILGCMRFFGLGLMRPLEDVE